MSAVDITITGMVFCFLLLAIPIFISYRLKLKLINPTLESTIRMTLQLIFVGFFLTFVFDLNSSLLNILWIIVMIIVASYTVLRDSELKQGSLLIPLAVSFALANIGILLYFNNFVIGLTDLFDARYLIPIAGMVIGNSLRANIVAMNDFCYQIQRDENRYLSSLSLGAEKYEALKPYMRRSLRNSLKPTIANMATVGIVYLPGMMTGQIIAGSSPLTAVEYQIAIMIAIYVSTVMNVVLGVLILMHQGFDRYGIFRKSMLKEA
ncbi:MAG: ABC transporter permease [Methanolobus sp.]|nr:ABC transporter permease [Methanolobus sp.]